MTTSFHRIDGAGQTWVLVCAEACMPRLLYVGDALPPDTDLAAIELAEAPALPHGGLDVRELVTWLPEPGRGFTDAPGLELRRGHRRLYTQFVLHQATRLAEGWRFELHDDAAALELGLTLTLHADSGVLRAEAALTNRGADELSVDAMVTMALAVPAQLDQRLSLGGRWAGEFRAARESIGSAGWLQESRVGRTSHHAFPGVVLLREGTDAGSGEALAVQLAWSGNHRILLQRCRLGGVQLQVGELLLPGEVVLQPGEQYRAPALHLARSEQGLRVLSLRWHRFVRQRVLPADLAPRPVQFNTWEATYFDHDAARLDALATEAAMLGVERFVLDDGWFIGRRDDRAGLGDWTPCPERYPQGLAPLAERCRGLGMRFGLWVEPEGVSRDSAMHHAHPEWVMGVPALQQPLGRHQYVLNLGLPAVREHLLRQLSALLESAAIDFLKWDMNRDMTHAAGPDGRAAARAHVLGVYALMDELRSRFPQLEIESCASGGGRADLGVLQRTQRVWVSDCNDPVERQRIQHGFLGFFPPEVMGVHVGDARSHTTGRVSDIGLRTLNALFGHFGIEADVLRMPADERAMLKAAIAVYKAERNWLHRGDVTAIDAPDPGLQVVLALSADGQQGMVSVVAVERARHAVTAPLRLPGLEAEARYRLDLHPLWPARADAGKTRCALPSDEGVGPLSGRALAVMGVALPVLLPGSGVLLRLRRSATLSR